MTVMFSSYVDISPASLSAWTMKDLASNCPAGTAGIVVLCHNTNATTSYIVGIRKNGSTDDIKDSLRYGSSATFFIGISTTRRADIYSESSDVKWWLLGYLTDEDAVFFDNAYDHTPTGLSTWQDQTISEAPSDAEGAFWLLQGKHFSIGICEKGATWDKDILSPAQLVGALVGIDASKKSETYKTDASQKHYVVGYLKAGRGDVHPDNTLWIGGTPGDWLMYDLSGDVAVPTLAVATIVRLENTVAPKKAAFRPTFSSEEHYAIPYDQRWAIAKNPGAKRFEYKMEDTSTYISFYTTAYLYKAEVDEDQQVVGTGVISAFDTWEIGQVDILALVGYDIQPEIGDVLGVGVISAQDWQTYMENRLITANMNVRAIAAEPSAPAVKGINPAPNETFVLRNKKVGFYIVGATLDEVDIDTVVVRINGVSYQKGDPEFSYSGYGEQYWIEVNHPLWGYEAIITVQIDATSMLNQVMATKTYGFLTEWESHKTREGTPRIELYEAGEYGLEVLTIQEDWVRQATPRESLLFELWYGRYMRLPYVENIEMRVISGTGNSLGREVIDNGWLSVSLDGGAYTPVVSSTVLYMGPMFSHRKRDIRFKLSIPDGANTKKYMLLRFQFTPKCFRGYGEFTYDTGIYLSDGELVSFNPNLIAYRAYVFDNAMWNELIISGIITTPFYRGEDKQW